MKINDIIDKIYEQCFGEDLRELLEFTSNNYKVTIKDQLLHYYNDKCLVYSEEYTIKAIHITIDENRALLEQLADIIKNKQKILDLREHNDITLQVGTKIYSSNSQSVGYSGTKSKSRGDQENLMNENSSNFSNQSLDGAQSESNDLQDFNKIIPKTQIQQISQSSFSRNQEGKIVINKIEQPIQQKNPLQDKRPVQYQNYQTQYTEDASLSAASTNSTTISQSDVEAGSLNSTLNIHANTGNKTKDRIKIRAYDARIKMWTVRLPNIRREFWHKFQYLFRDEYYY